MKGCASALARHRFGIRIALGSLLIAVISLCDRASAEIYRCTVDGRVVYTDHPCGAQSTKIPIQPAPPARSIEAVNLQDEANLGRIAVGMTAAQVEQAWGRPAEITSERDSGGSADHWTYNRAGEITKISFQNSKVFKIAKTQTLAQPAAAAEQTPSLTISELEDRERRDKAAERRFMRPGMTQEEVRGKLGPPSDRVVRATSFGVADCWSYEPAPRDAQTLTTVCFSVIDTRLVTIDRTIKR
jgi:outer membrane protein assembly factor BamE (lipoprotein component of BamABCDE complex)